MKTAIISFFCIIASIAFADDLKTTDGKEYKDVTITKVEPDGITVTTDSGIEKIPFTSLPEDIQKKYGYTPEKSAQYQKAAYEARLADIQKKIQEDPYANYSLNPQLAEAQIAILQKAAASAPPVIQNVDGVFSTKQIISEYDANELAADQSYKGKRVTVQGTVTDIGSGIAGDIYVVLNTGVHCEFPDDARDQLANLSKGQTIVVRGIVKGKILGSVYLQKCFISQ